MRKYRFIIVWFWVIALLVACDNEQYDPSEYKPSLNAHYLDVSETDFVLSTSGSAVREFSVYSLSTPWNFAKTQKWVSLSPMSGSSDAYVNMSIEENFSAEAARICAFFLESNQPDWKVSIPMKVEQAAAIPTASVSMSSITFSGKSEQKEITVTSNCTWTAESSVTWVTITKSGDDKLILTSSVNNVGTSRSGTVYIKKNNSTLARITLKQQAPGVTISTSPISCGMGAAKYDISFNSDADWKATTSETWLQVSPATGKAGASKLTLDVSPNTTINSRSGYVYIYIGSYKIASLKVTQEGIYLNWENSSCTLTSGTTGATVKINSNSSWKIKSVPDWLSVVPVEGKGNADVKLIPKENTATSNRTAAITAYIEGVSLSRNLSVTQKGKSLSVNTTKLVCSDDAQVLKVNVTSDGNWTAKTSDSWISLSPPSLNGNGVLSISVKENFEENGRTGKVTVSMYDKVYEITVVQDGKIFKMEVSKTLIGSTGGKLQIDLITNCNWTASVENTPSWLSISPSSGTDSASVIATFADNPSVNPRRANIVIAPNTGKTVKVAVEQAARYLTVSHQNIIFFAKGGTEDNIIIATDGKCSVTSDSDWFTFKFNNDGSISVTAKENTTKNVREGIIKIKLTDLKQGTLELSLPVIQNADGCSFIKNDYKEDVNWSLDAGGSSSLKLTVTGFSEDKNWDAGLLNKQLTVTITGYNPDKNWDN